MRNSLKIVLSLVVAIFFLSFSSSDKIQIEKNNSLVKGDTLTWKVLGEIKYVKKNHPKYGEVQFPVVNDKVKLRGKKKIYISGFIVPIDNKSYALSKNVFAACFFCGKSGPESIVGLNFKGATPKLKTDQYVTIEGTFRYNEDDADDWIYNLDNAVIVKGN
ncbi:hypothetical protein [Flavobacterium sp.]|uniref:hypothetical protein n=1 Tax=Flavobacterium sp. TaxID=239 RepID=UPI00262641D2|nr:hypothetical protein [Flavobacterium sp.]